MCRWDKLNLAVSLTPNKMTPAWQAVSFYSQNLDMRMGNSLHWNKECFRKGRDHNSGDPISQNSQIVQMLIAYTALGLAGGGPADWAMKKLSWQMAQNLSLQLLQRPPEDSIYLKFASPGMLPNKVQVQLNCHLPTHQTTRVPKHAASASPLVASSPGPVHMKKRDLFEWCSLLKEWSGIFAASAVWDQGLLLARLAFISKTVDYREERWFLSWLLQQNELWRPFQSTKELVYSAG